MSDQGEIIAATREGVKRYNDIKMALVDLAFNDASVITFPAHGADGWVAVMPDDDIRYVWIAHTNKNPVTEKSVSFDHMTRVPAAALAEVYTWRDKND